MFPALLGPVFPMDMRTANEIISADLTASPAFASGTAAASVGDGSAGKPVPGSRQVTGRVKDLRFPPTSSLDALSAKVGFPAAVIRDLQTAHHLVEKICAKQPWLDASLRTEGKQTDWQYDAQSGKMRRVEAGGSFSQRLVNALLSLYSASALEFCTSEEANKRGALPVPIAWENRDRFVLLRVILALIDCLCSRSHCCCIM
jgi:hypothetical protein